MLNEQDQDKSLLTDYGRKWLAALSESHKSWIPLMHSLTDQDYSAERVKKYAGEVLVYHNHMFVTARQLVEAAIAEADLNSPQYLGSHEYGCACAVHDMSSRLSEPDSRAFMLASPYYGVDLDELATAAGKP